MVELKRLAANDPRWVIFGHALGSTDETMNLHVMKSDVLSSFLQPNPSTAWAFAHENVVEHNEGVVVKRSDGLLPGLRQQYPMKRTYLKLDTQGFDLQVIIGAGTELHTIAALQTELAFRHIYEGMPEALDVLACLKLQGFAVSGVFSLVSDSAFRLLEADGVLVNSELASAR